MYVAALVDEDGIPQYLTKPTTDMNWIMQVAAKESLEAKKLDEWQARLMDIDRRRKRLKGWAKAHGIDWNSASDMDALGHLYERDPLTTVVERWHSQKRGAGGETGSVNPPSIFQSVPNPATPQ